MHENKNIFGCFVSSPASLRNSDQARANSSPDKGYLFRKYVWGESGICDALKKLRHEDYGKDLVLVLFQFYVNPIPEWLTKLKEIESYRKKEKAIGIPIVVNDEDFFNKTEKERRRFLEKSIFQKLDLLAEVIKRRKLDTDINRLASDLKKIFI